MRRACPECAARSPFTGAALLLRAADGVRFWTTALALILVALRVLETCL